MCPSCGEIAAEPGAWYLVHAKKNKQGEPIQEAVSCWHCGTFLLASPDDAVDPVRIGEPYDEQVYHCFARPDGWTPPGPRLLKRPPREQDWVRIDDATLGEDDTGKQVRLQQAEGAIKKIDADTQRALVAVSGFCADNCHTYWVPVHACKPMLFVRYHVGDCIRIRRGPYRGEIGKILSQDRAIMRVELPSSLGPPSRKAPITITINQERVEQVDPEEVSA